MSQLRFGFCLLWVLGLFVWFGVLVFWLLCLFCSGSYLLIPLFEFIYGDLCLSAHIAPVPVQKKTRSPKTTMPIIPLCTLQRRLWTTIFGDSMVRRVHLEAIREPPSAGFLSQFQSKPHVPGKIGFRSLELWCVAGHFAIMCEGKHSSPSIVQSLRKDRCHEVLES